jgi:hypothetical protein
VKHTPGEWRAAHGIGWSNVYGPCNVNVGHCSDTGVCSASESYYIAREEREANANLIAAAPDLLAACKEAYFAWAHGAGSVTTSDDPDTRANAERNIREGKRIMKLIAAAIAKAEGGAK